MIHVVKNHSHPCKMGELAVKGQLNLAEVIVIPSLLYNAVAFHKITDKEMDELEKLQKKVLTGILELPSSTPYIPLLIETGFWPMKDRIAYKNRCFTKISYLSIYYIFRI